VKVLGNNPPEGSITPTLAWLWPSGLSLSALVSATLIAVFIYWGWDSAVAVNEETKDPATTPGRAAILSTLLLLATYAIVSIAMVAFAGVGDTGVGLGNPDNADDIFAALGSQVFGESSLGHVMEVLLVITVLTSASASTQTTILPTARTSLSMAAYRAIPSRFARIHPEHLSPSSSTVWMGVISIVFYVGLTLLSENILADSIAAVGLLIAFYYGLTGFACVWFYRRTLTTSLRHFVMRGLFPFLGGVMLLGAFVIASYQYAQPDYGYTSILGIGGVFVLGIGSLVLGLILMYVWQARHPAYFRGQTLPKRAADELVLAHGGTQQPRVALPDSGEMATVIAPDRSNLPPGATAVRPQDQDPPEK
jgi:amino acid transporter